jgi:hypothetical protein
MELVPIWIILVLVAVSIVFMACAKEGAKNEKREENSEEGRFIL